MSRFRPLRDGILVRRAEKEEKTSGGIILMKPQDQKEGEIIEVGSGRIAANGNVIPLALKVGDNVVFSKWSGTAVTVNGEELMVMKEGDILGYWEQGS